MRNMTGNEVKLNELLRAFRTNDAIVECNSVREYNTLLTFLKNYGYGIGPDESEFTEKDERDFELFPYLIVAPDDYIYSYSDICVAKVVWNDPIHTIHTVTSVAELMELDKTVQQMKDFKKGKFMVAVNSDYEYNTLINYLEQNGMSGSVIVYRLEKKVTCFYAYDSSSYTTNSMEAIKKHVRINKVVAFSDFVPGMAEKQRDATATKDADATITKDEDIIHVPFINKNNLMNALHDRFHEENQPNNITQVNLGDIISFIKDYEPDFSKENEGGTSFGEKEDAAKERIEENALHHLDSLLDRKKEEIIFRLNHAHGSKDQSAVLMDEIKKASLEAAEWLKQERTAKSMAVSFENADAMLAVLNRGTALYNLDNGKYVWLYSEDGDVAVDNINVLTANKIAKESVEQSDCWEVFLPMGAQIYTKEEIKNFCEDNCYSTWITSEDYEKTLGLSRDMEQNKDTIERD